MSERLAGKVALDHRCRERQELRRRDSAAEGATVVVTDVDDAGTKTVAVPYR